jgi:membrane protein YdbS with pleckstrin-like domain
MDEKPRRRRKKRRTKSKETAYWSVVFGLILLPIIWYMIHRIAKKRHLEETYVFIATGVIWAVAMFTYLMIVRDRRKHKSSINSHPTIGVDYGHVDDDEE